jgi:NADH:ubiquinone oxidoreductase subunit 4 (subunit M)
MLSHGVVSSALFLCVGVIYDRHKTRIIKYYSGLTVKMPLFSMIFLFFILANMGFPGTSSFVSEFLVLTGSFKSNVFVTVVATTGVIWGAAYSIWLYNRVMFGNIRTSHISAFQDLERREFMVFVPCVFLTLLMGLYPEIFLNAMHVSITHLIEQVQ